MSRLFASDDQSTGASVSASSPSNEYSGLISFRANYTPMKLKKKKKKERKKTYISSTEEAPNITQKRTLCVATLRNTVGLYVVACKDVHNVLLRVRKGRCRAL